MQPDEIRAIAQEIATQLGETTPDPVYQIQMLIQHLGIDHVMRKVQETFEVEQKGGIMTQDGSRRRTPGGVFFYVIKRDMDPNVRLTIFPGFGQSRKRGATIDWEKRMDILEPLLNEERGTAHQIRVHLQGRPGKVEVLEDSVIMIFEHFHETSPRDENKAGMPQLPRGVPAPPSDPTRYVVYMGINQWERVQGFMEHPRDQLVIEGLLYFDAAIQGIAVFALGVTTKELERRQRRAEKLAAHQQEQKAIAAATKAALKQQGAAGAGKKDPEKLAKSAAAAAAAALQKKQPAQPSIPENMPSDVVEQLQKLYAAADTLRGRIAAKEAQGQKPAMEQKLLQNTEKQIENLRRQYS